jgi:glucose-6-phosphate isomerase
MSSHYRQSLSPAGLATAYSNALERAHAALGEVRADVKAGHLHALTIAGESDDLVAARALAEPIRQEAEHVVILGIGGSSLGAQALAQLKDYYTPLGFLPVDGPRVHFLDNPDAETMTKLMDALKVDRTRFVVISKSGGTAEPMMQALSVIDEIKRRASQAAISKLMMIVSEPKENALTRLAKTHGLKALDHPTDIGGRYSVLSVVGLFPALLMGLEPAHVRAGAAKLLADSFDGKSTAVVEGAAFSVAAAEAGRDVQVMMAYADRLERFVMWYRQLWAESLGKQGKGTLPVRALGPVDQHSQLQLYLEGPPCAAFTVMTLDQKGLGPTVSKGATGDPGLGYLEGKAIGDLVMAEARATYETFASHKLPCRLIALDKLSEETVGALIMHFMLETIVSAKLLGVNAFDQPAVEEGKVLARRYMVET